MTQVTLKLNPAEKKPREWIDRMINNAETGTRIEYWIGLTDVDPKGVRKQLFDHMRDRSVQGKVHLVQEKIDGSYRYLGVVR